MDPVTGALATRFGARHGKRLIVGIAVLLCLTAAAGVFLVGGLVAMVSTSGASGSEPACGDVGTQPTTTGGGALSFRLNAEQQSNATVIGQVAAGLHVPTKGLVIGYMAAIQESHLTNLTWGDADSVGMFQQRPSQGWGSPAQLVDPVYSSTKFFTALLAVPGWPDMDPGAAAQAVQRSAKPGAYTQWLPDATVLAAQVPGTDLSAEGGCGAPADCPQVPGQNEEHLTPDAIAVLRCGLAAFPQITQTIGWAAGTGHIAGSLHYTGQAVDLMLPVPATSAASVALGDQIAQWAYDNRDTYGVTEIIWNAQIRTKAHGWGWRPYVNPGCPGGRAAGCSATLEHRDHVHISVAGHAGTYGSGAVVGGVTLPIPAGQYVLTARFGDCGGRWANCHTGLDFAAPTGTPIHAVAAGVVVAVAAYPGRCVHGCAYGNLTEIDHGGGVHTWYAHQSEIDVTVGQVVKAGDVIGRVGATGNVSGAHVHLEVRLGAGGGRDGTPVDPFTWLTGKGLKP